MMSALKDLTTREKNSERSLEPLSLLMHEIHRKKPKAPNRLRIAIVALIPA